MHAATIIVCLLFVCGILAQTSAPYMGNSCSKVNFKCAGNNAACNTDRTYDAGSDTINYLECSNGQYCKAASGGTTGTCTSTFAAGAACSATNGDVCVAGYYCNSTQNICVAISINGLGADCNGYTSDCQTNLYCNTTGGFSGKCAAVTANNGDCTTTQACFPGWYCSSNKCVAYFSLNSGDSCSEFTQCNVGLACTGGKCGTLASSSNKACSNSSDTTSCTNSGEYCTFDHCSGKTEIYECKVLGFVVSNNEKSVANNFWNCQNSHTSDICDTTAALSCKNCKSQACAFGSGLSTKLCGYGDCSSAASVVASFVMLIAALFVAM